MSRRKGETVISDNECAASECKTKSTLSPSPSPINGRGELIAGLQQSQQAFEASEIFAAEAAPTDLGGFGSRLKPLLQERGETSGLAFTPPQSTAR